MVMPFMSLMMTLTTIGLPVAISRLVAEADAQRDRQKIKKILLIALSITVSLSILMVFLSTIGAKIFLPYFLTDQRAYYSFMAMIPVIPIGAVSGVLKGYFRGKQTMNPLAIAQVLEQIVRIWFTYVLVQRLLPLGIEFAAAGAVLSGVLGEAASLLVFIIMFRISQQRKLRLPRPAWSQVTRGKTIVMELLQTGLPTTGNGFGMSISRALQPIVITKSLALAGIGSALIAKQYGMLAGFVMPLLFLPGFINQSLGITLVPAISEANAHGNLLLIKRRLNQAIGVALIIGAPSTVVLYLFSLELMTVIYHAPAAAPMLKLLAPFFVLNYLQSPLQSVLVGMGRAKTAMINNVLARFITIMLIYPLASNPKLGIKGVIIAMGMGVILETLLHHSSLVKLIGFFLNGQTIAKILAAAMAMGYIGRTFFVLLCSPRVHLGVPISLVVGIIVSIFVYIFLLNMLKVIRKNDLARIPLLGKLFPFWH